MVGDFVVVVVVVVGLVVLLVLGCCVGFVGFGVIVWRGIGIW